MKDAGARSVEARGAGGGVKPRVKRSGTRGIGRAIATSSRSERRRMINVDEPSAARFAGSLNDHRHTQGSASLHPGPYAAACFAGLRTRTRVPQSIGSVPYLIAPEKSCLWRRSLTHQRVLL